MKRGQSGLSLVVAVNKPSGITSHDVVNRCRRIFGERRVGHTGTLDPLASGVLPICIGPATRLDRYMVGHDKQYRVTIGFGYETDTDDCEGVPTVSGSVPSDLLDGDFADGYIAGLVGFHDQVPPQYSAVKVQGKKAYEAARKGQALELEPRRIQVKEARLLERREATSGLQWEVDFTVSSGTYIRALVRDIGRELGCPAHVDALVRNQCGAISIAECVELDSLEAYGARAAVDPVDLLGMRLVFADDWAVSVESGRSIPVRIPAGNGFLKGTDIGLFEIDKNTVSCTSALRGSLSPLLPGEKICMIIGNRLKAIYAYDEKSGNLKPDCVFSVPIIRTHID